MAIQGNKIENNGGGDFSYSVGLFSGKVVDINPDKETLMEMTGMPEAVAEKFSTYEATFKNAESEDEEDVSKIVFWMKTEEDKYFSHTVNLMDKDQVSKAGANQKINAVGNVSYPSNTTGELPDWFTAKGGVRNAKVGEQSLYNFLTCWMSNFDFKNGDEFQVDFKKLMKGNVKELRQMMGLEFETNVTGMAIVNVKESIDDDGDSSAKYYQGVWREFLPEWAYDVFKKKGRNGNKTLSRFFDTLTEGEYACKAQYHVGALKDFNPDESVVGAASAKVGTSSSNEDDDSDY